MSSERDHPKRRMKHPRGNFARVRDINLVMTTLEKISNNFQDLETCWGWYALAALDVSLVRSSTQRGQNYVILNGQCSFSIISVIFNL